MANHLSVEKKKRIFQLLCEGTGIRSITRHIGCSTNTVSELQKRYCHIIEFINKKYIKQLNMPEIEADELRVFVYKKTNIRWVYVALDRASKMVVHFHIGQRDHADAKMFLEGLSKKMSIKCEVNTDSLVSYISAVKKNSYGRIYSGIANINLIRAKEEGRVLGRGISNHIETHNGNIRQHVSRLIRKTRCFSKKEEGLRQHLTLYFFYYNFIKKHSTLKTVPVVAAGITSMPLDLGALIEYDLLFSEKLSNSDSKNTYGVLEPKKVVKMEKSLMDEFISDMTAKKGVKEGTNRGTYKKQAKVVGI